MTGNKGEWSELYTLFKLLATGKLYAADENTNRIPDICYNVLNVLRLDKSGKFEYNRETEIKVVNAETGELVCAVPIQLFAEQAEKLLSEIKSVKEKNGAFELPDIRHFAESVQCQSLKAKSQDKADIYLMVHDIMSGRDDTFGFSIKSQLGSPSTLLNASKATNFNYIVTNYRLLDSEIEMFNGFKNFKQKFGYLNSLGADIKFDAINNETFNFNLQMVSGDMPNIFAEMIKLYYKGNGNKISDLTELTANSGIVNTLDNNIYIKHKIKCFLTNIALGMVPDTVWTGDYEATGGYIIVKDDGDVVCYHIYNRNAFMNYMFKNTRFDTPSQTRHKFGKIYEEHGCQMLKLNVQIRFIK